jgi:hypothetical protein
VDQELYEALPADLRPGHPDEVGMVAWLDWKPEAITTPRQLGKNYYIFGYRWVCTVTLIDRRTDTQLAVREFRGPGPAESVPDPKTGKTPDFYGDRPYVEILAYLEQLPRKPG